MSTPAPLPRPLRMADYQLLAEFRYTLKRFLRFSQAAARQAGVSPQQHQALLAIKGYPGRSSVTVGELAERLQLRHNSTVGLVDRLVDNGLVRRQRGTTDQRQVQIRLTDRGERLLRQLSRVHRDELQRLEPALRTMLNQIAQG